MSSPEAVAVSDQRPSIDAQPPAKLFVADKSAGVCFCNCLPGQGDYVGRRRRKFPLTIIIKHELRVQKLERLDSFFFGKRLDALYEQLFRGHPHKYTNPLVPLTASRCSSWKACSRLDP